VSNGAPIKAMSYLLSWLERQGEYAIRPKVEMPEKTESACGEGLEWAVSDFQADFHEGGQ
jgi:hypothetical protein